MKLPRASLVRRLTFGFVSSQLVGLLVVLVVMLPLGREEDDGLLGADVVTSMLHEDVIETDHGLELRPQSSFATFAPKTPGVWFVAMKGQHVLRWGPVPKEADSVLAALPPLTLVAQFGDIGATGRMGDMDIERIDADPASLLIAAGGVQPKAVGWGDWFTYLNQEGFILITICIALFSLLGALTAIPILLRSIQPTARAAAALDSSDPAQRLPEKRVVKELLPIVRAINGALERLEAGFEGRRRFIADVAHELRTPLTVMTMHIDGLQDCKGREDLQRSVFRLGQMVGQMLDAERLAMNGRPHQIIDLVALSKSAVADIAPLAVAGGYDIAFVSEVENVRVHADSHAVMRAVMNLLGNAIAHGGNSGCIEVRVLKKGCIDISDEGPGVPHDARERIFEPFRRERWDRDGCGLGLHLVREIMLSHNGDVRLLNSDTGAVFRLDFHANG